MLEQFINWGIHGIFIQLNLILILSSVSDYLMELCRAGIFGKLQQVMQKEKEIDMDFWKKLHAGARPDSKTFAFILSALSILV